MAEKEIFSSNDESIISRLCVILENKGISYIRKDGGAGSYLSIAHGQDVLSQKKIFVSEEDYENVRELIDFLGLEDEKENENVPKALKVIPIEDEFGYGKYHTIKVILGVFIGTALLLLFLFFIVQVLIFVFKKY